MQVVNQGKHTVVVAAIVLFITAPLALLATNSENFRWLATMPVFIFMVGTVGGVANNFRRLQKLSSNDRIELSRVARKMAVLQLYLSPVIGGIFASLLYVIFMGGLVEGDFFPAFANRGDAFDDVRSLADRTVPATNADAAKALVWAFVAGFAERFVPNILDKIAKEQPEAAAAGSSQA